MTSKNKRKLLPEALRAIKEAEERRKKEDSTKVDLPKEVDGPSGPEPTRYGDWERKGITSDF